MSTAIFNSAAAPKSYEFKVVLLGDRGVGKTCLVLRFIEGLYNARQQSTIGAFFLTKKIKTSRGDDCKIQIWDTAGQERFRAMAPMYYRNAAAAVVCFDGTDQRTFQTMRTWVEELRANVDDKKLVIAIAITKSDLDENRAETRRRRARALRDGSRARHRVAGRGAPRGVRSAKGPVPENRAGAGAGARAIQ